MILPYIFYGYMGFDLGLKPKEKAELAGMEDCSKSPQNNCE